MLALAPLPIAVVLLSVAREPEPNANASEPDAVVCLPNAKELSPVPLANHPIDTALPALTASLPIAIAPL